MLEPHPESDTIASQAERQPLLAPDVSAHDNSKDDGNAPGAQDTPIPAEKISLRVCAAMLSFFIMGIHTAAIGVLIPSLESHYHISDTLVSLLFVTPLSGYLLASLSNSTIHFHFGRRGIAFLGAICQLLVTIIAACHPPYTIFLLTFAVAGFGAGLIDAGWCAWAGGLHNANTVSGFLHGSYSAGAMVGPYLTIALIADPGTGAGLPWYSFYWVMTGVAVLQILILTWAFRHDSGERYRTEKAQIQTHDPISTGSDAKALWTYPVLYICAIYLIFYEGAETIIAGWIVTFMQRIRAASPFAASTCASGFWAGMALGRMSLGSLTDRFGERRSVSVYLLCALAAETVFVLITPVAVAVVAITMLGFCLGPLFPTGIVMVTRLMPRELHVGAVAAVAVVGQVGGAVFPFVLGATAERLGIQALQPFVFVLLAGALGVWWCFPKLPARKEQPSEAGE